MHKQEAEQTDGQHNQSMQTLSLHGPTNIETDRSAESPVLDDSLPEDVASLLAITSTADISQTTETSAMVFLLCSILSITASESSMMC